VAESGAVITAVFPTYNAADAVAALVDSVRRQDAPASAPPDRWLEVIFIDNASTDDTVERIEQELAVAELPYRVRVIRNEENLGLSRSFNRALEAVATKYVLTCHADCLFASGDYLARLVALLDQHPDVAVVSGQPIADVSGGLSRVEKVYLTANLMDVFPEGEGELEPVGFAEGRCDGFRMEPLRAVGYYDTTLQRAGEDQIMSARLRALGFRVCRAPQLRYFLSVSSDPVTRISSAASPRTCCSPTAGRFRGSPDPSPAATAAVARRCARSSSPAPARCSGSADLS
jgi:glycosyltransferase involved in cell wall biosynthesis